MRYSYRLVSITLMCVLAAFVPLDLVARQTGLPLVVVLTETDTPDQDNLPVYRRHPSPDSIIEALTKGVSGTMLRVYRMEQRYLHEKDGQRPEPAYVLLSGDQGGYARKGFVLDGNSKPEAGYVDVHRDWPLQGKYGAIDQIVPHELAHVIRRQVVGDLIDGGTNQVHAIGLRTDRVVAFNEGFAEHLQAIAFERSPDVPVFAELAADTLVVERVYRNFRRYERELRARFAPVSPMRMAFVAWYSNDEDVLRYHGVRDNVFARAPEIPERLLRAHPYRAYLLDSVIPGDPSAPPKSVARMAASEGVVASFFYRWAMDERIGARRLNSEFYEQFGTSGGAVSDLENTYLKMVDAMYVAKPQSVFEMVDGYMRRFPEEAPWIDEIAREVFHGLLHDLSKEIWLSNRDMKTGTTLFDQYRGMPRVHTFDLNAASVVDLASVPGISPELARRIIDAGPYDTPSDIERVGGVSLEMAEKFESMHSDMDVLRTELEEGEGVELTFTSILMPGIVRGILAILVSGLAGLAAYGLIRRRAGLHRLAWYRSVWVVLAVGLVGSVAGWLPSPLDICRVGLRRYPRRNSDRRVVLTEMVVIDAEDLRIVRIPRPLRALYLIP